MSVKNRSLGARIGKLEQYVRTIKRLQKQVDRKRFFSEELLQDAIERNLQLALEAVLDIADQIIAQEGFSKPEEYRDNILILGKEGVLPKSFAEKFAPAANFRNALVQDYLDLDLKKVYGHFKHDATDIEQFLKYCRLSWQKVTTGLTNLRKGI